MRFSYLDRQPDAPTPANVRFAGRSRGLTRCAQSPFAAPSFARGDRELLTGGLGFTLAVEDDPAQHRWALCFIVSQPRARLGRRRRDDQSLGTCQRLECFHILDVSRERRAIFNRFSIVARRLRTDMRRVVYADSSTRRCVPAGGSAQGARNNNCDG
jgi:hypothetical protein